MPRIALLGRRQHGVPARRWTSRVAPFGIHSDRRRRTCSQAPNAESAIWMSRPSGVAWHFAATRCDAMLSSSAL
jgi:hypothetical protein